MTFSFRRMILNENIKLFFFSKETPCQGWGRETHICISILTIITSDNGLLPDRRKAIIWTNSGILLIRPLRTNFNEILIEIHIYSFKKMHLKCRLENGGLDLKVLTMDLPLFSTNQSVQMHKYYTLYQHNIVNIKTSVIKHFIRYKAT